MTIGGWVAVIFGWLIIAIFATIIIVLNNDETALVTVTVIVGLILCVGLYFGVNWYFTSTASGIRAATDERSELRNGLERTINVYTANGDKMAVYQGKIDLEMNQDYIKFDWEGKRYIYYNCFVETIAEIP